MGPCRQVTCRHIYVNDSWRSRVYRKQHGHGSDRDHVIEPYARAHDGVTQPASVGLGLSVARKLAQMMDGDLELTRQDGWTVFTLTLPPHAKVAAPQRVRQPVAAS